jgi:hypothetical protein
MRRREPFTEANGRLTAGGVKDLHRVAVIEGDGAQDNEARPDVVTAPVATDDLGHDLRR